MVDQSVRVERVVGEMRTQGCGVSSSVCWFVVVFAFASAFVSTSSTSVPSSSSSKSSSGIYSFVTFSASRTMGGALRPAISWICSGVERESLRKRR